MADKPLALSGYDFKRLWRDPEVWSMDPDANGKLQSRWYLEDMDVAIDGKRDPAYFDQLTEQEELQIADTALVVVFGGYFCWQGKSERPPPEMNEQSLPQDFVERATQWLERQTRHSLGIVVEGPAEAHFDELKSELEALIRRHPAFSLRLAEPTAPKGAPKP